MKKDFLSYKENKKPFAKWDLAVLGIIIFLVVILVLVLFIPKAEPTYAYIYKDGNLYKTVKLADRTYPEVIELSGMRIVIETDGVTVTESDCDDGCCLLKGKITKKKDCIVCLPNMITIELK